MANREIYLVIASVVDSNGTFTIMSGYPKSYDSKNYGGDLAKTRMRAEGDWHETIGAMCKREDRQVQTVVLVRISDGSVILSQSIGAFQEPEEVAE